MEILIRNNQKRVRVDLKRLERLSQAILEDLRSHDCEISLLLIDNPEIQKLNKKYLGRDRPTDVISFPMGEGEFGELNPHILGDVVVSVERACELAREREITPVTMIVILLIHGILHLHGYDHEKDAGDARIMEKEESRLLTLLKEKNLLLSSPELRQKENQDGVYLKPS